MSTPTNIHSKDEDTHNRLCQFAVDYRKLQIAYKEKSCNDAAIFIFRRLNPTHGCTQPMANWPSLRTTSSSTQVRCVMSLSCWTVLNSQQTPIIIDSSRRVDIRWLWVYARWSNYHGCLSECVYAVTGGSIPHTEGKDDAAVCAAKIDASP